MNETHPDGWLSELELDPASSPISMGVRLLANRPWLLSDANRESELELKASLSTTHHREVFAAEPGTESAADAVVELLTANDVEVAYEPARHPLENAGLSVQEDLCLLRRDEWGWILAAGSVCFPSRWKLRHKLGRDITQIHEPVAGYASNLAPKVNVLFDRLGEQPVWRRNWFIHPDHSLFQPARPAGGDPLVPRGSALEDLVVRSERQTLRRLETMPDWILFTIRIQQATIGRLAAVPERGVALRNYLEHAPPEVLTHRGVSPEQASILTAALAGTAE